MAKLGISPLAYVKIAKSPKTRLARISRMSRTIAIQRPHTTLWLNLKGGNAD
jgi:hypothetical protein